MIFFQFCLTISEKWIFQGNIFESAMSFTMLVIPLCAAPVLKCIDKNRQESVHVYALTFLRDLVVFDASMGITSEFSKLAFLRCTVNTLRSFGGTFLNLRVFIFLLRVKSKRIKLYALFKRNPLVRIESYIYS